MPDVLNHMSRVLFMQARLGSDDVALASKAETGRAILRVLQVRTDFLVSKGINDMTHQMTTAERTEFVEIEKKKFEVSKDQTAVQTNDEKTWKAQQCEDGASQPIVITDDEELQNSDSLQRSEGWTQHLESICGTQQIWEMLAYSGELNMVLLMNLLETEQPKKASAPDDEDLKRRRRQLQQELVEARSRLIEGQRLHQIREQLIISHLLVSSRFTEKQREVLKNFDEGKLDENLKNACAALEKLPHDGEMAHYQHVSKSSSVGSKRFAPGWQMPDFRKIVKEEVEAE